MKRARFTVITAKLTILFMIVSAMAQPVPPAFTATKVEESPSASDSRISLNLAPSAQETLKQTMQEHLQALQAIVAALAQENYVKASAVAHEKLGFPKHHEVMQKERGTAFPKKYQELAMVHHQAAEDLASVILTKEAKPILQQLDQTMKACVDCHRAYKL